MPREILVPVDGSEPAWEALSFALEHHPLADITAYYVISVVSVPDEAVMESTSTDEMELYEAREERAEEVLAEAEQRATRHPDDHGADHGTEHPSRESREYGVDIDTDFDRGYPYEEILEYAEDHDFDHIIMGSHGRSGLTRLFVGSVAEKVTRAAPVPVTIVRPEAAEA